MDGGEAPIGAVAKLLPYTSLQIDERLENSIGISANGLAFLAINYIVYCNGANVKCLLKEKKRQTIFMPGVLLCLLQRFVTTNFFRLFQLVVIAYIRDCLGSFHDLGCKLFDIVFIRDACCRHIYTNRPAGRAPAA